MYLDILQKEQNVRNLQRMLRSITIAEGRPQPLVAITGVYNEQTRAAVADFQKWKGMTGQTDAQGNTIPAGTVDYTVWEAVRRAYEEAVLDLEGGAGLFVFPFRHTVKRGERSDLVALIQLMLDTLRLFTDIRPVTVSGMYDAGTEEAVAQFQETHGLPVNGQVDAATWNAMAHAYNDAVAASQ